MPSLEQKLEALWSQAALPPWSRLHIRCLALLWHDHWTAAHHLCQNDASAEGSCLHGILHRREPDFSNAKYWFRQVANHHAFDALAPSAAAWLAEQQELDLAAKLVVNGHWNPFAFVDACAQVFKEPETSPRVQVLQRLQALECAQWLDYFVHGNA